MDKLSRIIGPAPSERTFEELCEHLRSERSRVTSGLQAYMNRSVPTKKKPSPPKKQKDLSLIDQMKQLGLSLEDLKKLSTLAKEADGDD